MLFAQDQHKPLTTVLRFTENKDVSKACVAGHSDRIIRGTDTNVQVAQKVEAWRKG